jgi:hypothetical protein
MRGGDRQADFMGDERRLTDDGRAELERLCALTAKLKQRADDMQARIRRIDVMADTRAHDAVKRAAEA